MIDDGTVALRLVVAAALGGLVGLERELKDQPAGFRTHILVAIGSCLFALVSGWGYQEFAGANGAGIIRADVTRIASQVVVGIGFIGAGTILREGGTVRGLTTAASLWVTAAVGVSVAAGFVLGAAITVTIALAALAVLKPFERRVLRDRGEPSAPPE